MPSPFPGMDPYLEHPQTWPNVHHRLISAIAIALGPQLRPNYRIVVEEAVYQTDGTDSVLVGIPDVSVPRTEASIASTTATLPAPTIARFVCLQFARCHSNFCATATRQ
ncbi:MAG: DUF4058 family protein [Cyanobacteria bacterium J06635_1]